MHSFGKLFSLALVAAAAACVALLLLEDEARDEAEESGPDTAGPDVDRPSPEPAGV